MAYKSPELPTTFTEVLIENSGVFLSMFTGLLLGVVIGALATALHFSNKKPAS